LSMSRLSFSAGMLVYEWEGAMGFIYVD